MRRTHIIIFDGVQIVHNTLIQIILGNLLEILINNCSFLTFIVLSDDVKACSSLVGNLLGATPTHN